MLREDRSRPREGGPESDDSTTSYTGHCFDCGRRWSGNAEAHCPTWCEHFSSDDAFDAHLAGPDSDIACYPPASLTKRNGDERFVQVERAHGPTWMFNRPDLLAKETALSHLRASSDSTTGAA